MVLSILPFHLKCFVVKAVVALVCIPPRLHTSVLRVGPTLGACLSWNGLRRMEGSCLLPQVEQVTIDGSIMIEIASEKLVRRIWYNDKSE